MVDATALGAVVVIRVGSSPSISKFYIRNHLRLAPHTVLKTVVTARLIVRCDVIPPIFGMSYQ